MDTSFYADEAYVRIIRIFQKLKRQNNPRKCDYENYVEINLKSFGQQHDDGRKVVEYLFTNRRADNPLSLKGIIKSYIGRHSNENKSLLIPKILLQNKNHGHLDESSEILARSMINYYLASR